MSFDNSEKEIRQRFGETRMLLDYLRAIAPPELKPVPPLQKAQRGLWLVSLYAAIDRSVNATVESALADISKERVQSSNAIAPIHSIFHFPKVQSLHSCGRGSIFDKSVNLFEASLGDQVLEISDNPLAASLQNVDSNTMDWVLSLFGANPMSPTPASRGRVNTLRENRNAISHGRESAASVGQRYQIKELSNLYNAADEVITAFRASLKMHCSSKLYLKKPA